MAASAIDGRDGERAAHFVAIEALAQELGRPVEEVRQVYETHYERLKADASVGQYLVLLATRRARDEFRRRIRPVRLHRQGAVA
jgi:hypothetical protein